MAVPRSVPTVGRCVAVALLTLAALAACRSTPPAAGAGVLSTASATPTPTPTPRVTPSAPATPIVHTTATPHPSLTLRVTPTVHPPTVRPRLGDLTIHLARGDCGYYSDTSGGLWLNPRLVVGWTGPGAFPGAVLGFSMKTNYGKATAGGPVTSTAPFTWAIGGEQAVGNSWLGHTVTITVTIDPGNDVAESNESNNVTLITVDVPTPLGFSPTGSDGDHTIPCS